MSDLGKRILSDAELREQFKNDPRSVLAEHGRSLPEGIEVTVVESTPEHRYIVLPAFSEEGELTDDELSAVAGGGIGYEYGPQKAGGGHEM